MVRLGLTVVAQDAPAPPRGKKHATQGGIVSEGGSEYTRVARASPTFAALRLACAQAQPNLDKARRSDSALANGDGLKGSIADLSGAILAKDGYARKTVARVLLLLRGGVSCASWDAASRSDLQQRVPGESGVLEQFPSRTSAAAISMFTFSRPDWGLMVTFWSCSLKQVPQIMDSAGVPPDEIDGKAICEAAATLFDETGRESPPAAVARSWLEKRAREQPTPEDSHCDAAGQRRSRQRRR